MSMKTHATEHPYSKLIAVEFDFLVSRDAWYGGVEDFLRKHVEVEPEHPHSISEMGQHLDEKEFSTFMDRSSRAYVYLGSIAWKPLDAVSKSIRGSFMAMAWKPDSFVLQMLFGPKANTRIDVIPKDWLSGKPDELRDSLLKASSHPPVQICQWRYFVDESLKNVHNTDETDELVAWSKTHPSKQLGHYFADFSSETQVLQILIRSPMLYHWRLAHYPSELPPYLTPEVEAAIKYRATMEEFSGIKLHAEESVKEAFSIGWSDDVPTTPTGFWAQLASLHPHYTDELPKLEDKVEKINQSAMALRNDLQKLNYLFFPYQYDTLWVWGQGKFRLAHIGYEMGPLVSMKKEEVGELTLVEYYRGSALRIQQFYSEKFQSAADQLEKLLENWKTASSIRVEQQTVQLNRLVLLLTIISAILAILQVVTAIEGWNNLQTLGIAVALLLVIVVALVIYANAQIQRPN